MWPYVTILTIGLTCTTSTWHWQDSRCAIRCIQDTRLVPDGCLFFILVQYQVIPAVLDSVISGSIMSKLGLPPRDICCSAPTGSGKTLAFVLPIIQVTVRKTSSKHSTCTIYSISFAFKVSYVWYYKVRILLIEGSIGVDHGSVKIIAFMASKLIGSSFFIEPTFQMFINPRLKVFHQLSWVLYEHKEHYSAATARQSFPVKPLSLKSRYSFECQYELWSISICIYYICAWVQNISLYKYDGYLLKRWCHYNNRNSFRFESANQPNIVIYSQFTS